MKKFQIQLYLVGKREICSSGRVRTYNILQYNVFTKFSIQKLFACKQERSICTIQPYCTIVEDSIIFKWILYDFSFDP